MTEQELIKIIIDELKENALENHRKELEEKNHSYTNELTALSKEVDKILADMPKNHADIINSYISKSSVIADDDCSYLYMQGAKDCIKLLKYLEIL